jgi:hypothetical protein
MEGFMAETVETAVAVETAAAVVAAIKKRNG